MIELLDKQLYIFDLDGTLYVGDRNLPGATQTIERLRDLGKKVLFLTNNSSRSRKTYVTRLRDMGFGAKENEVLTSGTVTVQYLLAHRPKANIFLLGTPDLAEEFTEAGLTLTDEGADTVVVGCDTTLDYERLMRAGILLQQGAEFFATHPDLRCPGPEGFIPDCGAIAGALTAGRGREAIILGKPSAHTGEIVRRMTGIATEDMLFVGDRLSTDIACGKRNGAHSLLVLTGEATEQDTVLCPPDQRPDAILPSVAELFAGAY